MHIKDLNDQVGERPTSAIFRDSKLEPLKISVTPSIARDGNLISPVDNTLEKVLGKLCCIRLTCRLLITRTKLLKRRNLIESGHYR
jgi:hypothetical protein